MINLSGYYKLMMSKGLKLLIQSTKIQATKDDVTVKIIDMDMKERENNYLHEIVAWFDK